MLATLAGNRVISQCREDGSHRVRMFDTVWGIRVVAPNETILYQPTLSTDQGDYQAMRTIFESLIQSFRLTRALG